MAAAMQAMTVLDVRNAKGAAMGVEMCEPLADAIAAKVALVFMAMDAYQMIGVGGFGIVSRDDAEGFRWMQDDAFAAGGLEALSDALVARGFRRR